MPTKWKTEGQRGSVLILYLISAFFMLGVFGLLIDTGYAYAIRTRLQNIADAAALAGASQLGTGDNQAPRNAVQRYLVNNGLTAANLHEPIEYRDADDQSVEISQASRVRITMTQDINTVFSQLFGVQPMSVVVVAMAKNDGVANSAGGKRFPYRIYAGNELYLGNEIINNLPGDVYAKGITLRHNSILKLKNSSIYTNTMTRVHETDEDSKLNYPDKTLTYTRKDYEPSPNGKIQYSYEELAAQDSTVKETSDGRKVDLDALRDYYLNDIANREDTVRYTEKLLNDWRISNLGSYTNPYPVASDVPEGPYTSVKGGVAYQPPGSKVELALKNPDLISKPIYYKGNLDLQVSFYPIKGPIIVDGDLRIIGDKNLPNGSPFSEVSLGDIYCTGTVTIEKASPKTFNGAIIAKNIEFRPVFTSNNGVKHTINGPLIATNDIKFSEYRGTGWHSEYYDPWDVSEYQYGLADDDGRLLLIE